MSAMEPEHYVIKSSINRPVVVNYKPLDQSRILTSCMTAQAGLEWIDAWTERRERRKLMGGVDSIFIS